MYSVSSSSLSACMLAFLPFYDNSTTLKLLAFNRDEKLGFDSNYLCSLFSISSNAFILTLRLFSTGSIVIAGSVPSSHL